MYIAPRQGLTAPGDKILMSTERPYHITHLLQVKKKFLWSLILYNVFHDFIHVYSPGAGADNPLATKFWCQQKCLVTSVIYYKFKKISLKSDFIQQKPLVTSIICYKLKKNFFEVLFYTMFFMILYMYMYIAPGQEQTAPWQQSFDVNRNVSSLHSFVASLKKSL